MSISLIAKFSFVDVLKGITSIFQGRGGYSNESLLPMHEAD